MHDGINLEELAQNTVLPSLHELEEKVKLNDHTSMSQSFDNLTVSCNKCHSASGHSFIRIKVPEGESFPNQDFRRLDN